jgi:hypothetical protein
MTQGIMPLPTPNIAQCTIRGVPVIECFYVLYATSSAKRKFMYHMDGGIGGCGDVLVARVSRKESELFKNAPVVGEFGVVVLASLLRDASDGLFDKDLTRL